MNNYITLKIESTHDTIISRFHLFNSHPSFLQHNFKIKKK